MALWKIVRGTKEIKLVQTLGIIGSRLNTAGERDETNKTSKEKQIQTEKKQIQKDKAKCKIDFNDTITAFQSKTTAELIRGLFVYQMTSFPKLVENSKQLMALTMKILPNKIFKLLMKATFFGHFVGGESEKEVIPLIHKMDSFGVKSILDYSSEEDVSSEVASMLEDKALGAPVEEYLPQFKINSNELDRRRNVVSARIYFYRDELQCEKHLEYFLKSIDISATCQGMVAIKMTALCKPRLLLAISDVITKTRIHMSKLYLDYDCGTDTIKPISSHRIPKEKITDKLKYFKRKENVEKFLEKVTADEEGVIHIFPWSGLLDNDFRVGEVFQVPDPETGEFVNFLTQLTTEEEEQFINMACRLNKVMLAGLQAGVSVMVDAEQTYFQPAISRLTVELMRKYNKEKGVVYNTYQTYLRGSYEEVLSDLEQARRQGFLFRCKLVRGAYLEQEKARAIEHKYADPIQPSVEATSNNYHATMLECLSRMKSEEKETEPKVAIMIASHNEATIKEAVATMERLGIDAKQGSVKFGQLLGMCDFLTYTMAQAGHSTYKYVPYGPIDEVLPYLARRAIENRGVLENVKKEKKLLSKEIFRRIKKGDMNRNPK